MKKTKYISIIFLFVKKDLHKTSDNVYYLLKKNLGDLGNSTTLFKQQIFSCVNSQPAATVIIFSK